MKTNFKVNLGEINVRGIELKDINIEAGFEYNMNEIKECYELFKTAVKDLPEIMEDAKNAFYKFNEIEKEVEGNPEVCNLRRFLKEQNEKEIEKRIMNKNNQTPNTIAFNKGTNIKSVEDFLKLNGKTIFGEEVYIDPSMHFIRSKKDSRCLAHIEITD